MLDTERVVFWRRWRKCCFVTHCWENTLKQINKRISWLAAPQDEEKNVTKRSKHSIKYIKYQRIKDSKHWGPNIIII